MSLFKRKEVPQEKQYYVLPHALENDARFKALQKKKRVASKDLKKDLAKYMATHSRDLQTPKRAHLKPEPRIRYVQHINDSD